MSATVVAGCREPAAEAPIPALRLALAIPDELAVDPSLGLALSPDGRRLVFGTVSDGERQLRLLDLTTGDTQALPGTNGGSSPFWSQSGQRLGFVAAGRLLSFDASNDQSPELASTAAALGAVWQSDDAVIFSRGTDSGLSRRATDGSIVPLTTIGPDETSHRHPQLLADGRHVVFFVRSSQATRAGIWIAPLDNPAARKRLAASEAHGLVVGNTLLYASGDALVAQAIDVERLALQGRPVVIAAHVGRGPAQQLFAANGGDILVYAAPQSTLRSLRWVDRQGASLATVGEPMEAWEVRLAPHRGEESAVAATRLDPQLGTLDIWIYEGQRPLPRRLSPAIDADESPVWSPDGSRLAWVSGRRTVMMRGAGARLPQTTLQRFEHAVQPTSWTSDGRWLVLNAVRPGTGSDVLIMSTTGAETPRPYASTSFNESAGMVSPDGRWLAYASDESGRADIYVDEFPNPGRRTRLSLGGGTHPRWRRDGAELFFRREGELHAVRLGVSRDATGQGVVAASSERLFDAGADLRAFDVSADGQRFLLNLPTGAGRQAALSAIVHVGGLLPSAP